MRALASFNTIHRQMPPFNWFGQDHPDLFASRPLTATSKHRARLVSHKNEFHAYWRGIGLARDYLYWGAHTALIRHPPGQGITFKLEVVPTSSRCGQHVKASILGHGRWRRHQTLDQ